MISTQGGNITIIADIGSTHGNSLAYFDRAIDVAADLGVWLKCQLFGPEVAVGGNIRLMPSIFRRAMDRAAHKDVVMFASVWRDEDYELLKSCSCAHIKFAYSQRQSPLIARAIEDFVTVYVSGQHIDTVRNDRPMVNLLCIPRYPVYEQLSFDECFPPFDGFSDHTLGIAQTVDAVNAGAQYIEKHVAFNGYIACPDAGFAIGERELKELVNAVSK
jgi:sialic acid synthase SpsE